MCSSRRPRPRRGTLSINDVYHVPVLLAESMEALAVRPDGTYLDATAGGGGHLREILARLDTRGTAIGIDRDPDSIAWINAHMERGAATLILEQCPFSHFDTVLSRHGIGAVDGMLLDLGVSSHQIDTQERGFSYMKPSDLDMRMDPASGMSAADFCAAAEREGTCGRARRLWGNHQPASHGPRHQGLCAAPADPHVGGPRVLPQKRIRRFVSGQGDRKGVPGAEDSRQRRAVGTVPPALPLHSQKSGMAAGSW